MDGDSGDATFAGNVTTGPLTVTRGDAGNTNVLQASAGGNVLMGASQQVVIDTSTGNATFANGNCGFTSAGELFFTSRNERYKMIVSNGICQAEPYTRQMELKEKAEQFIADKRETKPSDQVEVTTDNDNAS